MKIDSDALEEALQQLAEDKLMAELREAIVYGPLILNEIVTAYLNICERKQSDSI